MLAYVGKPVEVIVRTAAQMAAVLKANPFPKAAPNRTVAIFLDEPPPPDALERAVGVKDEAMRLGPREIFVHYASGIGKSKLKIPIARRGSARNISTIAKLADMAKNLQRSGPLITAPTKLSPTRDVLCCGAGVRS